MSNTPRAQDDPAVVAREVARALRAGRRAMAFTGAGASAGSGVRPFRAPGATGLWWSGVALCGLPLGGDGRAWQTWPRVAYFFYKHFFLSGVRSAEPNACHTFLADVGAAVVTTNVDGLHERAGAAAENVAAVHGTVHQEACSGCGRGLGACARIHPCCGYPRPAVLLFNDAFFLTNVQAANGLACDLLLSMRDAETPLLFVVGVSWALPTFAQHLAEMRSYGARVIHVNLVPPPGKIGAPGDAWVAEPAEVFFGRCREAYFVG